MSNKVGSPGRGLNALADIALWMGIIAVVIIGVVVLFMII